MPRFVLIAGLPLITAALWLGVVYSSNPPDTARIIALAFLILLVGITARVVLLYYRANKRAKGKAKGLLPHHVWSIGVSYLILATAGAVEILIRTGDPVTWRPPVYFAAAGLGVYALWHVLAFEGRRVNLTRGEVQERGSADED